MPRDLAACGVTHDDAGRRAADGPGGLCYVPPPGLEFDLARAKAEVAAARAEGGVPAKLHYIFNAGGEAHKQIAEYAQAAWRAIGLDVELEAQEWNAMLAATRSGDFEIARLGNIGNVADTESEFLPLFRCASPDNRGRYCSPEFERLMDDARTLTDRAARNAKLRDAEAQMIGDAPVIPLYVYTQKHLIKPYVHDLAINLVDHPSLWRAWIDPDWRARGIDPLRPRPAGRERRRDLRGRDRELLALARGARRSVRYRRAAVGGGAARDGGALRPARLARDPVRARARGARARRSRALDEARRHGERADRGARAGERRSSACAGSRWRSIFGVGIGVIAAWRRNTWVDYALMGVALVGISVPSFVLGPLLIAAVAIHLGWLPPARIVGASSYILPAATLGMIYLGTIARLTRVGMIETLSQDFVRTARAKGLPSAAWCGSTRSASGSRRS